MMEQKAYRGRNLEWNSSCGEAVLADAERAKQEGTQGKWQLESPFNEVLEQVKKSSDLSCNACLMRRAYYAGKPGDWEGYKVASRDQGEMSEWAFNSAK